MLYTEQAKSETGDANWRTNNYHVADNLHMTQHSALLDASLICAALKKMGYQTTDYAYTYKDLSSIVKENETDTNATLRGAESGVTRIYSVAEAEKFIAANASPEEVFNQTWDFSTNQTAESGSNVPVLSGTAVWDETYQNIKFDANTREEGGLQISLNPSVSGNIIRVSFDLYVGMLQQTFAYDILDNEDTSLVSCSFQKSSGTNEGTLMIAGTSAAQGTELTNAITAIAANPMTKPAIPVVNEFDFNEQTIKVTIGSTVFTGRMTGRETGTAAAVSMKATRAKTNPDRHIYLDNLSVKAYETASADTGTQTKFPEFEREVYTAENGKTLWYRVHKPVNAKESLPVILALHGETRKGSDNESQLYHVQHLYESLKSSGTDCILVVPQCPSDSAWADQEVLLQGLAAQIENADSDKIYLFGYGEGADACYDLLETGMFAAAIAAAGSKGSVNAQAIVSANAAVLAVNGSEETKNARAVIRELNDAGSVHAEYNEIYGAGSGILEQAQGADAIEWLFRKSLTSNAQKIRRKVDLAIFMGQSNMAGRGEYADAVKCPVGHGYEFRSVTQSDLLFAVNGPFGKSENNDSVNDNGSDGKDRRSGDMVSALMESYYQATQTPLVGIQCSRGGSDLSYWNKGAQKAEAQARLTAARTYLEQNNYEIGHIFMVWVQGEADADKIYSGSQTVETYKENTLKVFDYMKTAGVTDMFLVQTGHYNGTDDDAAAHDAAYVAVHDAQGRLAEENENVYAVGTLLAYKESMKDQYHYHQNAYNEVGTAAGAAIAAVYAE